MIKKLLTFAMKGLLVMLLVLQFIYNVQTIQNLKSELSCISQGFQTIEYYLSSLKKETIDNIRRDAEFAKLLSDLIKVVDAGDTALSEKLVNTTKNTVALENELRNIINSLKNDIEEQRLADQVHTALDISEIKISIENDIISKETKVQELERAFHDIDVMILNELGFQGSGVWIKHKGKHYILSAGHLIKNNDDILWAVENDEYICNLKIIKYDKKRDIALFISENPNYVPKKYAELADEELTVGSEIYVVGNPMGIEDVISKGRLIKYNGFYAYFQNHSYFGSSGGGIYTLEGKLLGIVVYLIPLNPMVDKSGIPPFVIHGAVRLNQIKMFLGDIG